MSANELDFENGMMVAIMDFYRNNPPPSAIIENFVVLERTPPSSPKKDLLQMAIDGLDISPIHMPTFSPVVSPISPLKKTPEELRKVLADISNKKIQPLIQPHIFKVPQLPTTNKNKISPIQPLKLACPKCDKQFSKQGFLKRHMEYHDENTPNVCHICVRKFKPENFKKHMGERHGIAIEMRKTKFNSN